MTTIFFMSKAIGKQVRHISRHFSWPQNGGVMKIINYLICRRFFVILYYQIICMFPWLLSIWLQATLVNSTMLNSILSLTSKWQPGPNFFSYIFIAIRLCLTRITANVKLLITRYEFSAPTCAFSCIFHCLTRIDFWWFFFSLMVRYIGNIVCLNSFQTIKVNRFVGRKVEQKKTSIFLSYLISSHSPWSFMSVKIN